MNTLRTLLVLVVFCSVSRAIPPAAPPRIDVAFDEFQRFFPERIERWRKFIQDRVPRPSNDHAAMLWDGLKACSSSVQAEHIPNIRRAFEERQRDKLVDEFERLILSLDDFQWCATELLLSGVAKKQIVLDDLLIEELSGFWRDLRQYRTRFGWTLRQETKEDAKKNQNQSSQPTR